MGSEYDRKFEEMKKYIPFLESMIKRLESNNTLSSNPRQAQLDKIRSLRDLLLDRKKRMKMDNLLKCEQVLVNLYAKVEQKDSLPVVKEEKTDSSKDGSDLEAVRVKLKTVAKIQNMTDTLPEIARASEREEICEPGSKEPALFQRRPNKSSLSPMKPSPKKAQETKISPKSQSRRSYTRVLVSPEPRSSRWVGDEVPPTDKPLFSRRSPRRSPRRITPPYHKKERKKPSKSKEKKSRKDLNITLKVPEESLHSLNTDDIFSRIINCSDGDVNIDTLRELRSQILGELKQTGTNDDISELILKSYNKKPKSRRKKKPEVEEGEISDSESEVIENVYGSLVVMDKDKKPGQVKTAAEKSNQQRKIQICLVINSDKEENKPVTEIDHSESGMFENKSKDVICIDSDTPQDIKTNKSERKQSPNRAHNDLNEIDKNCVDATTTEQNESKASVAETGYATAMTSDPPNESENSPNKSLKTPTKILFSPSQSFQSPSLVKSQEGSSEATKNIVNFYESHSEKAHSDKTSNLTSDQSKQSDNLLTWSMVPAKEQDSVDKITDNSTEIPLLNEPTLPPQAKKDVLSEIDILQALKNEILSETIPIAVTSETDTPALHQPKISKVALASDTVSAVGSSTIRYVERSSEMPKKRISIENYKNKSFRSLFLKKRSNAKRKEMKKQSLKLTEKECERFNFPTKLALDDDTDDISDDDLLEEDKDWSVDDIYGDLAPKSPDVELIENFDVAPVVMIPIEPVEATDFTSKTDVDLRSISTPPQPVTPPAGLSTAVAPALTADNLNNPPVFETNIKVPDGNRIALVDPRLRRDQPANKDSPNSYGTINLEGTPRPPLFPNIPPLLGQIYTPSYTPSMTPIRTPSGRTYETTPSYPSFENEEPQQKHVYAPSFSMCDNRDLSVAKDRPVWEINSSSNSTDDPRSRKDAINTHWEYSRGNSAQRDPQPNYNPRNDKFFVDRRDGYSKTDCPTTPVPSFGWTDNPSTQRKSFGLLETPRTPSHSFGRSDCPTTPISSFGRSDCPTTPIPSFGRSDCPPTPSHSFGGSECPPTPSHPFGRSECPATPNHPFGRSDNKDPRLSRRQSDYEPRNQHDERDHGYHNERSFNRSNSFKSHSKPYSGSDSPRNYDREQYFGRSDRYRSEQGSRYSKSKVSDPPHRFERERSIGRSGKIYPNELSDRGFDRAQRDHSVNRGIQREDSSRLFTRNRDGRFENRYSDNNEEVFIPRNQKEGSVGKVIPMGSFRGRAESVSKSDCTNSLSVQPKAGRSFTIDTSVNATFQSLIESGKGIQVFDYTFDARRKRAASVGRSLVRESSVDRSLSHEDNSKKDKSTVLTCLRRRENFQRASSVGRVIVSDKKEKSFQEIKADFESYRFSTCKNLNKIETVACKKDSLEVKKAKTSDSNSRSRKDEFDKHGRSSKNNAKQPYSPRKNNRDPRMRVDQKDLKHDRGSSNSWDRRHSGISYSNDNIAKGTIMGTGFGVKNYKIPKIKRPEPERPKTPIEEIITEHDKVKTTTPTIDAGKKGKANDKKDKNKNSDDDLLLKSKTTTLRVQLEKKNTAEKFVEKKDKDNSDDSKNKLVRIKDSKKAVISGDDSEKRVTRSSKKSDSNLGQESIKKLKRIRKAIADDSESDDETELKTLTDKTKSKSKPLISIESEKPTKQKVNEVSQSSTAEKELRKTLEDDSLDSTFGIDDLEMFSDNIVPDPVIDNINELIADLDHDLGASKSTNDSFTTEMENIMGAIDNQEENTLGDISELIEKDLNESNETLKQNLIENKNDLNDKIELVCQNTVTPVVTDVVSKEQKTDPQINTECTSKKSDVDEKYEENDTNDSITASTDEIVSTTQIDPSNSIKSVGGNCIENKTIQKVYSIDQSAPDSTIVQNDENVQDKLQENFPDSTMDIHSEVSSDVTSTLNDAEKKGTVEPNLSQKEASAIESFGSLLSILQDKSKIKEFLSMLGGQSGESEKIKKKLEKLSEIVSDEEDVNDDLSRGCDANKSIRKSLQDPKESHEVTVQSADIEKPERDSASVRQNAKGQIDETIKNLCTDKINTELVKEVQLDGKNNSEPEKNKSEYSQAFVPENTQVVRNNPPSISQASVGKIDDGQDLDDQSGDLGSNEIQDEVVNEEIRKPSTKKTKFIKRGKGKYKRRANPKRINKTKESKLQDLKPKVPKKARNRELKNLQEDIKEMFMRDDVLNASGIRMCRLAKMVDKTDENIPKENEPVVLLRKYKSTESLEEPVKKTRKKPGPKPKPKIVVDSTVAEKYTESKIDKPKTITGYKPGPKSKTKQKNASDPYEFETDSFADTNTTKESDAASSDSDSESSVSSESFESSEVLSDIKKKPKKKRGSWQTGVIKPRHKKKKEQEPPFIPEVPKLQLPLQSVQIPDWNCFTDKTYCFQRGVNTYDCRLCHYSGAAIVNHYKKQHAHTEVPLSRMDPETAKKAIQQCEEVNIQAISKIPSEKYTCRFCHKEFSKTKVALETFFWHVVSTHTGEFKHLCYQCVNVTRCPFNLDIPPPPKDVKGQLIGYICGKCNYTQISLENLKMHVIVRHNDEQTEVYTINLGVMSQKSMKAMLRKNLTEDQTPRTLRSSRSNQSAVEVSDDRSEISGSDLLSEVSSAFPKIEEPDPDIDSALAEFKRTLKPGQMKSKIRFETDDQDRSDETSVKLEPEHEAEYSHGASLLEDTYHETHSETSELSKTNDTVQLEETNNESMLELATAESDDAINADTSLKHGQVLKTTDTANVLEPRRSTDVFVKPHIKLNYKETGAKEYVCCINGVDNHYRTTLLISLKKHIQTKHSENWDGYCCVCKVIVTLQGVQSSFKDCLTHFLDRHLDNFPVTEKAIENTNEDSRSSLRSSIDASTVERTDSPRSYIAVRPMSDLISTDVDGDPPVCDDSETSFPIIENVVSLGNKTVEVPQASPVYPTTSQGQVSKSNKPFQYEEVQAEVMSKKHRIVLDNMMSKELLVKVFKCAGRYCSFTSDFAEDSLVHASAHKQLGGEGAMDCAYCNFDAAGNAIDLVMHVFKEHGRCQFSCGQCFYRAAADQLVCAHITKAHEAISKSSKVLRNTTFPSSTTADSANILTRETAVPYYICKNGDGSCKFRTYTPGKFCEHMLQRHEFDAYRCYLCEVTKSTPSELVRHMKDHGLRLYQCTWCVHGADSEPELLSHVASVHPTKSPRGYLRIITSKDGSAEFRVLPLIYLNKTKKYSIEDVAPSKIKENPTREAERSIELEKLIRHTNLMLETESDNLSSEPSPETPKEAEAEAEIAESSDLTDQQTSQAIEKSLLSSPQKPHQVVVEPAIPVKDELEEARSANQRQDSVVYCLDSEEEKDEPQKKVSPKRKAKQAVIDLSDDELAAKPGRDTSVLRQIVSEPATKKQTQQDKPKFIKLSPEILFKCPNCEQHYRNIAGFKKHTNTCCLELSTIQCPHAPCPIVLTNITQVINHYNKDHNALNLTKHYYCGVCKSRGSTLNVTKKHLKDVHGVLKVAITSKIEDDGTCTFTILKEDRPVAGPLRRKASVETPKKFGIEDIDKLPINPIMDSLVYCSICEFSTKVRVNMVRHLQLHSERQPVPQTAPVNPVPHLESNEKHFDKMVNLASSSAATRDKLSTVAPEAAMRFPKFVPDRQRHTCGAKDCSYISVDEGMLRCHWETLHSGAVDYHCAHCPPHQHLDTSKLLTATRIIAHLKMHDANLYACSACPYYHHRKQIVEKHIFDTHKLKGAQVMIVREEGSIPSQAPAAVGTMDLRPWQCGLCMFKSMLRRDLIEHCSRHHHTKMQYKCAYCPFRTSDVDNITKHQSKSHASKAVDVFYYYYREGDVPDDADGTPRWRRQRQKSGIQESEVKTEPASDQREVQTPSTPIDLNLVKKEVDSINESEMSVEQLCRMYGQFCDPNGISYKCSLCKTVMEFTREAMQSHLYEELNYRRWSCAVCSYKAYHRAGLNEHMSSEHRSSFIEPAELPVNVNIEKWVAKLLDHQSAIIDGNKVNVQQKTAPQKLKDVAGPSKVVEPEMPKAVQSSDSELELAFGSFGTPKDDNYCCPKCKMSIKDEDEMRNHMESELTRIRWCCTKCTDKFQTFHEAQFHCKSHPGLLSRPKEAIRDPSLRSAWVSAVITTQKKSMKPSIPQVLENTDLDTSDNSLLVVRYEEAAPTEEQLREIARADQITELSRKRPVTSDSEDDENIHEPESKRINNRNCPYCDFVSKSTTQVKYCMREHILRHYNLKVLTCNYCPFNSSRKAMYQHLINDHPGLPQVYKQTEIPNVLPTVYDIQSKTKIVEEVAKKVCLHCEASVPENGLTTHVHGNSPSEFAEKGEVVVKCCICLTLRTTLETMKEHYEKAHPDITALNYAYYKLQIDTREVQSCGICNRRFTFLRDLRIHHSAMHRNFNLSYKTVPYRPEEDDHETRGKRKLEDVSTPIAKRIAKKSTSKLPFSKSVAKKSTTKLPIVYLDSDSEDEYSYYGTKPTSLNQYENVKTMMPMYNTMVEIDVKKLSGILKIDPKVVVKDIKIQKDEP